MPRAMLIFYRYVVLLQKIARKIIASNELVYAKLCIFMWPYQIWCKKALQFQKYKVGCKSQASEDQSIEAQKGKICIQDKQSQLRRKMHLPVSFGNMTRSCSKAIGALLGSDVTQTFAQLIIQVKMSRIITNTNIIVDDFDFCKSFPKDTFVHFLTHFHSDHYQGLSALWDYSTIHCTHQTKKFIMSKFPKLKRVFSYDYYQSCSLELAKGKITVDFTFFDAKHIPGSAMILFRGFMGTILFTGDFRYDYSMVLENSILFPLKLRNGEIKQDVVQKMDGISIKIDEMIFDNTYCNQFFKFQTEPFVANKIIDIIEKNKHKALVLIAMGALGKHRILMKISQHFQTNIILSEDQLKKMTLANLRTDFLTTKEEEGFIRLISKKRRAQIVEQTKKGPLGDSFICIDTDFLMLEHQSPDQISYIVPYSLHSNFKQMQTLVRMVQPSILRKIVIPYANFKQIKLRIKIDHRLKFARYLDFIQSKLQHSLSGYAYLTKHHTVIHELSKKYLRWFHPDQQRKLMNIFGIGTGQQNHDLRKRKPILLSDEQLSMASSKGKESLQSVANSLNAVHKNLTLLRAFQQQNQKNIQQRFTQLFEPEDQFSQKSARKSASQRHRLRSKGANDSDDSRDEATNQTWR